jgi:hypothetical protein
LKRKIGHFQGEWIPAVLPNLLFFKEKNKRIFPPIGAKEKHSTFLGTKNQSLIPKFRVLNLKQFTLILSSLCS